MTAVSRDCVVIVPLAEKTIGFKSLRMRSFRNKTRGKIRVQLFALYFFSKLSGGFAGTTGDPDGSSSCGFAGVGVTWAKDAGRLKNRKLIHIEMTIFNITSYFPSFLFHIRHLRKF